VKDANNIYEEAVKTGNVEKQGALGDGKDADKIIPGSGPSVEGLTDPVEGATGDEDETTQYLAKISQRLQKKPRKAGKSLKEGINICDMKNNGSNIFDKLYSVIMEDEELPDEFDLGGDDEGDEGLGDDLGDDLGGDEVSFSLPRDVAEQLSDALAVALGGGDDELEDAGDDIEDFEDEGDDMDELDEMSFREGVTLGTVKTEGNPTALKDGAPGLTGKSNKVGGKASKTKSGKANTGKVTTDGNPKALADGVARQQKGGKTGAKEQHIGD
jgi:hypothetical protein